MHGSTLFSRFAGARRRAGGARHDARGGRGAQRHRLLDGRRSGAAASARSGSPAAKPMGGKRPRKLVDERDWLLSRLAEKPDLTLHALLDELAASARSWCAAIRCGVFCSHERHQLQKKRFTPASRIALTSRGANGGGGVSSPGYDLARLVFIDETWTKTNMTRLRGWWRARRALAGKVPHGHWQTMTFLAALRS